MGLAKPKGLHYSDMDGIGLLTCVPDTSTRMMVQEISGIFVTRSRSMKQREPLDLRQDLGWSTHSRRGANSFLVHILSDVGISLTRYHPNESLCICSLRGPVAGRLSGYL